MLSVEVKAEEKLKLLEEEYQIMRTEELEEEVSQMCNLSQGVLEKGMKKGIEQGKIEIAKNLLLEGLSIELIAKNTDLPIDKIQSLQTKLQ